MLELKALAAEYGPDIKIMKGALDGSGSFLSNAGESMGTAFGTLADTMNGFADNMGSFYG